MKKSWIIILLMIGLASCKMPQARDISPEKGTENATETTQNLSTTTATVSKTATFTTTPSPSPTSTQEGLNFLSINTSNDRIHWGPCEPSEVEFTATVSDPSAIYSMVLFIRIKDKVTGDHTDWNSGMAMNPTGSGSFRYLLNATSVPSFNAYLDAWLQYQLVATNKQGTRILDSHVLAQKVTITGTCP